MNRHVFIIGSKGIPARYGGFETFVDKLTAGRINKKIKYHVACMKDSSSHDDVDEFEYNEAHCFNISVPSIGPSKAVYYDIASFKYCNNYIEKNNIQGAIVYVLACRIGPFINYYKKRLNQLGGKLYVNPDGHEWMRAKWNPLIRKYWKFSERLMVKHSELLICDSKNIEKYIQNDYKKYSPNTTYIAYGADISKSMLNNNSSEWIDWCKNNKIKSKEYFLVVGRFVPENNFETIIREFMKSSTAKDLVLVTNIEHNKFYNDLLIKTKFDKDKRIKFVGTVYNQELLKKIREEAFAYFHGHEVGGTNPSLLEALASTELNLLLDVGFNKEVAENGALYWNKNLGSLSYLIDTVDNISIEQINYYQENSTKRIENMFSWNRIINMCEDIFVI